jgi:hypothetical protein
MAGGSSRPTWKTPAPHRAVAEFQPGQKECGNTRTQAHQAEKPPSSDGVRGTHFAAVFFSIRNNPLISNAECGHVAVERPGARIVRVRPRRPRARRVAYLVDALLCAIIQRCGG